MTETARRLLACIDLTSLQDDQQDDIAGLCAKAHTPYGPVAAVCSWPRHVARMVLDLGAGGPAVAPVVNFPEGDDDPAAVLAEAEGALKAGAVELDLVFPYRAWLKGERSAGPRLVEAVKGAAPEACLKVILETGAFGEDQAALAEAAWAVVAAGADMLKTSSGKTAQGASPAAARTLLEVIRTADRPLGFKASGGIRTLEEAAVYLARADRAMGPDWA